MFTQSKEHGKLLVEMTAGDGMQTYAAATLARASAEFRPPACS
ncbi:hypothetical protein [Spirosoma montaniterrae]|nr:hypothetical protein [Spirosoma montaniterrae]